ncbi:MAG: tetratricopeptide repeat protein [Candidatus Acidiferrales bacterium]
MSDEKAASYEFGPFLLVVRERLLRKGAEPITLSPKEFDTLCILLRESGRLVTKDQIIGEVWPDSFVADGSLSRNISVIRKALGEGYIETVPKSGYRFIAAVSCSSSDPTLDRRTNAVDDLKPEATSKFPSGDLGEPTANPAGISVNAPQGSKSHADNGHSIWIALCLLLAVAVATGVVLIRRVKGSQKPGSANAMSLIVLPMENLTGAPSQDYLADGLTESMIARIGKLDPVSLRVIAVTTARRFKDSSRSPTEIGKELGVDYVLASNLRQQNDTVRISVEIVRAGDERDIWTAQYERESRNLTGLPNEIALSVAKYLQVGPKASPTAYQDEGTLDTEAYEDYLRGRFFWNKRLKEDVSIAREYFLKAIDRDPNYAKAYAGLADSYITLAGSHMAAEVAFAKAQESAEKAVFLDDTLAEAHTSLAYISYAENWDWARAEREYKRALELDPQYAVAHHWYFIYLTSMKRFDEAIAETEIALTLDSLSQSINYNAGMTYMLARRDDRALNQLQKAIELDPSNPVAYGYLGQLYERQQNYTAAIEEFKRAEQYETEKNTYQFEVASSLVRAGKLSEAKKLAEQLELFAQTHYTSPYGFVLMYSGYRDSEKVFPWLERAVKDHACTALEINTDPRLDYYRSDPRFHELTKVMDLP